MTEATTESDFTVVRRSTHSTPYIFPAHTQQYTFTIRPRMTHYEVVALNHAALTTMVSGQWTPRFPARNWDGSDIGRMRLHEDSTVLVDMQQLVPNSRHRPQLVDELTDSMLVRFVCHQYSMSDYCSAAAMFTPAR